MIQDLYWVTDANPGTSFSQPARDLHMTSGIRGRNYRCSGCSDLIDLSSQDLVRQIWFEEVVYACASAADIGVCQWY